MMKPADSSAGFFCLQHPPHEPSPFAFPSDIGPSLDKLGCRVLSLTPAADSAAFYLSEFSKW